MNFQSVPCLRLLSTIIVLFAGAIGAKSAPSTELAEPITLSSENGSLDILMVAKPAPIKTIPSSPEGWVYEICKRPGDGAQSCPGNGRSPNYYGGTLLHLEKGDTLRIRLVNQLPPILDSEHSREPGHEFLKLNPTNLHTHGLLVSPHPPKPDNPTYGDNIFVLTFNSKNGKPVVTPHIHSDIRYDFTEYEIKIPSSHPSGLFWFHPHAHGISLNQVTAGLSGLITIGNLTDYVCKDRGCAEFFSRVGVRHMILKDTQILEDGRLQSEEEPDFCAPHHTSEESWRHGACAGRDISEDGGEDYTGGHWYFTINGQVYPSIPIQSGSGEVWRLTNESASVTYKLHLWNPHQKRDMLFQVLSLDGVSVSPASGTSNSQKAEMAGRKFIPEPCPASASSRNPTNDSLCTRELLMMPSARAEVWVVYRDKNDKAAAAPDGEYATFRTSGYASGPSGDTWPSVDLARVDFSGPAETDAPQTLEVNGEASSMSAPTAIAANMLSANQAVPADSTCKALPPGHTRRIFYSNPTDNPDAFGLAYEELDEHGQIVGAPVTDVTQFNPMHPTICLPLGPGNTPVTERWQLVNVATEDHNFHIHQVKFRVLGKDETESAASPGALGVMFDNVPLPHAKGECGNDPPDDPGNPIAAWRAGKCIATPVTVEIPFAIAGDFVYHCHILEHEDGGMMARIRVRPNK